MTKVCEVCGGSGEEISQSASGEALIVPCQNCDRRFIRLDDHYEQQRWRVLGGLALGILVGAILGRFLVWG